MPKMIFVAHPMSGDIEGNTRKVIAICKSIHSEDVIPVFPSLLWRGYLGDSAEDRALAEMVNTPYFIRRFIDEMWLYGDRLSDGMKKEILLADKYHIPVFAKTPETDRALSAFHHP